MITKLIIETLSNIVMGAAVIAFFALVGALLVLFAYCTYLLYKISPSTIVGIFLILMLCWLVGFLCRMYVR